jgi:hypothetical protein
MDIVSVINRIFSKDQEIKINLKITNTKRFWFSKIRIVKDCGFKPYQCTSYFKDLLLNFYARHSILCLFHCELKSIEE